jgi:hypothetical protein
MKQFSAHSVRSNAGFYHGFKVKIVEGERKVGSGKRKVESGERKVGCGEIFVNLREQNCSSGMEFVYGI